MIKHFCDICGKPAVEIIPEMRMDFPLKAWSGTKNHPGSPNPTDGKWIPFVTAILVFDLHDSPRNFGSFHPDLCAGCVGEIITEIGRSVSLKAP